MPFELDITESEIYKMGQAQEARRLLSVMLEERFGQLSRTMRKRINEASQQQLDQWTHQSARAQKLTDVFKRQ